MLDSLFILTYPHVVCKLCVNKKSTKCDCSHFVDFRERKTMPHPHFEVAVYQSNYKRTFPLYHALVMYEERRIAYQCLGFSIQCKYTNRF